MGVHRDRGRSYDYLLLVRLMLVCIRNQAKIWKRLLIVVTVGLAGWWWLTRYWWPPDHVDIGQSLSLHVDESGIQLRLRSPDGTTRLRGTLGSVGDGVFVIGGVRSCSVDGSRDEGSCVVDMKVPASWMDEPVLRLKVAYADDVDCCTVKWQHHASASRKNVSVVDCYSLDDALWYGGAEVYYQRWPINAQRSEMQPHTTGDYLIPRWRSNPSYGKYGSLVEPYWLSSVGVGIIVDDYIALSSSFNAGGDSRLCLKGDRATTVKTDSGDVAEILSYTICRREDIAAVHRTMSGLFFPRPKGYPDVQMIRKPIWSTWAQYKVNVNQSSVEEMAEQILHYKFPHRYLCSAVPIFNYLQAKVHAERINSEDNYTL